MFLALLLNVIFNAVSNFILRLQEKLRPLAKNKVLEWKVLFRRRNEFEVVFENHFVCSSATEVPPESVLDPRATPVAYTDSKVILLKGDGDVYNCQKYPFFYHACFLEAKSKLVAPLDGFLELIDEQPWPELNIIFLWSVGRCGSTLLANLFTSFEGCVTISEPDDIFSTNLYRENASDFQNEKCLKISLKYHLIQVKIGLQGPNA